MNCSIIYFNIHFLYFLYENFVPNLFIFTFPIVIIECIYCNLYCYFFKFYKRILNSLIYVENIILCMYPILEKLHHNFVQIFKEFRISII